MKIYLLKSFITKKEKNIIDIEYLQDLFTHTNFTYFPQNYCSFFHNTSIL